MKIKVLGWKREPRNINKSPGMKTRAINLRFLDCKLEPMGKNKSHEVNKSTGMKMRAVKYKFER